MTIKCLIVDDEPIACKGMQEYVEQVDFLQLVAVCHDPMQAFSLLDREPVDLILLDIEMPRLSGLDFIRSLKNAPHIIFTTAYPNYALQGFELDVIDYLVKPIAFARFLKAVNKVKEQLQAKNPDSLPARDSFFVKENGNFTKVFFDELLYAEAMQNYVALHLVNKKLISYVTLTMLEQQLPGTDFMRIHKSYIVPLEKIEAMEGNLVVIGKARIPVSRKIKDALMQRVFENNLLKRT